MAVQALSQYNKNNPFLARITENTLLNKMGSSKETRHFVVDLEGSDLAYTCGDSLGIYPTNRPEEVNEVLVALGANGEETVVLPRTETAQSLRDVLLNKLSLNGPTRKTLEAFAEKVENPEEKSRLNQLLDEANKESSSEYLVNRGFIDILLDFPSARFSPQEFVDGLRKLVPRLYSIASSPTVYPRETHLTVAVVRYRTNNRERFGVCSTFLADRVQLGESILPVFVANSHFGLPGDNSVPIIMVGPGTGIAPFRAFMQERIATQASGRNWLFFGDQHAAFDYLYEDEFAGMLADGHLAHLDLAWSRDQEHKVYVQDKMLESATELWDWISNGAYFYVCGDAKRMARDVDAMLHRIAREQGGLSVEAAEEYFKLMKKEKRYQRDVY